MYKKERLQKLAGLLTEARSSVVGPWYVEEYHAIYGDQIVVDGLQTEEEAKAIAAKLYKKDKSGDSNYEVRNTEQDKFDELTEAHEDDPEYYKKDWEYKDEAIFEYGPDFERAGFNLVGLFQDVDTEVVELLGQTLRNHFSSTQG